MQGKFNVYESVSKRVIEMLDNGVIPWHRPWAGSTLAISRLSGKPYSILNQMLLSPDFDGSVASLNSGEFATFNQIKKSGGKVNKGAKAYKVVFWNQFVIKETNDEGVEVQKSIPILKWYSVFNIRDTDLKPKWVKEEPKVSPKPNEAAEEILEKYWNYEGVKVKNKERSSGAFYRPSEDLIVIPCIEQYEDAAEYYSTAFHESVHSTGHKSRLNRIKDGTGYGKEEYSKEELVAEIGAAALVSIVGIETENQFKNSAAYIQHWRDAISKDNRLIVSATGNAEKAIARILNPIKR